MSDRLGDGDLLPRIQTPVPGPESLRYAERLERFEAPGVNTLVGGVPAPLWEEARGANVIDVDGNRYIDLTSGFGAAAVGHRHPRVIAAVREQAGRLLHGLGDVAAHPLRVLLAERLSRISPVPDGKVYFSISGADAVEIALKTALLATGRPSVLAFDPAYHGTTLGALAATSRPAFRQPFLPHLTPHLTRLPYGCAIERISTRLDSEKVGCVVVEPVVGREGVLLPPPGWLPTLAEACRSAGCLLIADEIFTGLGRTGHLFAGDLEALRPDLVCCGKALGGGLPIAAVVGRGDLMDSWRSTGEALHTATFLAHPVACAASLATLDVLAEEQLVDRAATLGPSLGQRLSGLTERHSSLVDVRGRGLLWGLELNNSATAKRVASAAWREGVLLLTGGPEGRVVQIAPPLTIARRQLDFSMEVLERALGTPKN